VYASPSNEQKRHFKVVMVVSSKAILIAVACLLRGTLSPSVALVMARIASSLQGTGLVGAHRRMCGRMETRTECLKSPFAI
jgi:hypothetical protein